MVVSFDFSYFPCYTKINYKELYKKVKEGALWILALVSIHFIRYTTKIR